MPCYKPLLAYHAPGGITFNRKNSFGTPIELPCGRCIGCRLDHTKAWAIRCWHESQMHEDNCFITLTYDDYHVPQNDSLKKSDFQKFIRALRKQTGKKIRYYMCGEYGDTTSRPHYHAILFGFDFPDKTLWNIRNETKVFRSSLLEKIWDLGHSEIGNCTYQSAAYVARYIMKKISGEAAAEHYGKRIPEYTGMSLRPGIGYNWYKKYKNDVFPCDFLVTPDGRQMPVPKYYRRLLATEDPELHETLRAARVAKAEASPDNSWQRLAAREQCQLSKAERLKRNFL